MGGESGQLYWGGGYQGKPHPGVAAQAGLKDEYLSGDSREKGIPGRGHSTGKGVERGSGHEASGA